jgi:hypothetical protein
VSGHAPIHVLPSASSRDFHSILLASALTFS